MRRRAGNLAALALAVAAIASVGPIAAARAQETTSPQQPVVAAQPPRPRLALALSGGGARGLAHIGALRALEEAGVPVDALAANSMGAILGALYAGGRSAREIDALVRSLDWAALMNGPYDRRLVPVSRRQDRYGAIAGVSFDWRGVRLPAGLFPEHRINRFLIEYLAAAGFAADDDFDRLPIPFRAVAADLATGDPVVLARGDLALAVRASMSIPLAFPPVEWNGRRLVDALIVNNLPIDVARRFEPAIVVAVDVGSPPLEPSEYESAIGVASQVNDLLMRRRRLDFQAEADVVVRPELGRHSTTDYSGFEVLVAAGYEATRAAIPLIREKLSAAGVADLAPRARPEPDRLLRRAPIRRVVVRGNRRLEEALLRRSFDVPVGPAFDMQKALRGFDEVSATGLLQRTWMALEPDGDGVRVALDVTEAAPNRAEVGVAYTEWERTRGSVRLLNQNTVRFADRIELLLAASDAESLARLTVTGERLPLRAIGYRVRASSFTDKPRFFDADGSEVNRARFERTGLDLSLRSTVGGATDLEAGLRLGTVRTRPEAGIELPATRDSVRTLFAGVTHDTLDRLRWPEQGQSVAVEGEWSPEGLGGAHSFWRLSGRGRLGRRLGARTSLQLDGWLGFSGRDLPVHDWYRLGGVVLLPGYQRERLKGKEALAAAGSVRHRVFGDLRIVARVGAGNVFERTSDIGLGGTHWGVALGAMYPTRLGPVSAEVALHDGGGTLMSFSAGWD